MNELVPKGDFLLLVDASAYIHRSFHANARTRRRSDDQETGAIIAFCWSLMKIFRLNRTALGRRPSHAAIIMDSRGKNFRHDLYPLYKQNREAYEAGLESQLPFIPMAAEAFNIPCIMMPGWEADDIIATYATIAPLEGMPVVLASSDKDFGQLVNEKVLIYDPMKDRDGRHGEQLDNSKALVNTDAIKERWGVFPWQMIDLQALMGDTTDNIPGADGIGPVKAARLLNQFGSLEEILAAADWGTDGFKPKEHEAIMAVFDQLPLSKELVTLARNVPVELEVDDLYLKNADVRKLKAFFMDLEAPQLANKTDF